MHPATFETKNLQFLQATDWVALSRFLANYCLGFLQIRQHQLRAKKQYHTFKCYSYFESIDSHKNLASNNSLPPKAIGCLDKKLTCSNCTHSGIPRPHIMCHTPSLPTKERMPKGIKLGECSTSGACLALASPFLSPGVSDPHIESLQKRLVQQHGKEAKTQKATQGRKQNGREGPQLSLLTYSSKPIAHGANIEWGTGEINLQELLIIVSPAPASMKRAARAASAGNVEIMVKVKFTCVCESSNVHMISINFNQ
eukprot:Gb_03449 [translate_table: standard]